MEITIGKKTALLNFGIGFIREMDKRYRMGNANITFGAGITSAVTYLSQANPVILVDMIAAGTITEKSKPFSEMDIEEYLGGQDIGKMCLDFLELLKVSPMTRATIQKLEEAAN